MTTKRDNHLASVVAGILKEAEGMPSQVMQKQAINWGALFNRLKTWHANLPTRTKVMGWGTATASPIALLAAHSAWKRQAQGDLPYTLTQTEGATPALFAEFEERKKKQDDAVSEYLKTFQEDDAGGYIDPATGSVIGRKAMDARIGKMRRQAEMESKGWLDKEYKKRIGLPKFNPDTGKFEKVYVRPTRMNAADLDLEKFKTKMNEDRNILAQLVGSPFIHNKSLYFGTSNPYRNLFGGRNPFSGPNTDDNMRKYWRSGMVDSMLPGSTPSDLEY
jgi:hypothetical protein